MSVRMLIGAANQHKFETGKRSLAYCETSKRGKRDICGVTARERCRAVYSRKYIRPAVLAAGARESKLGRTVDALALTSDEGRDKLR